MFDSQSTQKQVRGKVGLRLAYAAVGRQHALLLALEHYTYALCFGLVCSELSILLCHPQSGVRVVTLSAWPGMAVPPLPHVAPPLFV